MIIKSNLLLLIPLVFISTVSNAVTTFHDGSGLLSTYNRSATFDSLDTNGINLLDYTENGLIISEEDTSLVSYLIKINFSPVQLV